MTQATTQARIRQITARELKSMLDDGLSLELFDVRTTAERAIVKIEPARHLYEAGVEYLQGLGRDTLLVFHCHQGIRSQMAAEPFLALGFTNTCNLVGSTDAWSVAVDPSVCCY